MNFKGNISALTAVVLVIVLCLAFVCGCTGEESGPARAEEDQAAEALDYLKEEVLSSLSETLALAEKTSDDLTKIDRNQTEVDTILDDSYKSLPWVDSAAFIAPDGVTVAVKPDSLSNLIGKNLMHQYVVKESIENQSPVMSDYMLLEEGEMGIVLEYPVIPEEGEFAGIVSLLIDPAKMVRPVAEEIKSKYGYSVMVAQPDGLILYDEDAGEIGNETFGNPVYEAYPEIIECAEIYSSQPSGTYSYTFKATGSDKEVQKQAFWDTAGILNQEWRLMIIKEM